MKKINGLAFLLFFAAVFIFGLTAFANASTPVLSLSTAGQTGDFVQINVTGGDPNTSVLLFAGSQMPVLGSTDASGNFSTTVSSATYSIVPNLAVYVKTGGLNGTMSNQVIWPYFTSATTSTITLSQTALLLNVGQTSTITAGASYLYVMSNSTPAVANINLNANQITVQALSYGSTVAKICVVGSTTNCASLTITVQNSSAQQLNFSQNNFSIISGQSANVTVTGGSGAYTITNNSNTNSIQANLSGYTVALTAANNSGSAAITVCTTDMASCGIINVSATTVNSSTISFSQTNPVVPLGQTTTVTIYGGVSGSNFYVSSNSNPSIVQANITGNILTLIANATSGSSNLSICAYAGSCASLTANVSNTGSANGAMSLSQTSVSILAGQSTNITILGGSTPYNFSSSTSANIFNQTINGNILTIYGVNPGTATGNVCSSSGCAIISVTVNNVNSTANGTPPTFSQNNILLTVGQQTSVYVSGSGNYYVTDNNNPNAVLLSINGSTITVTGGIAGSANISICQNGGQCANLYVTVSAPITTPAPTPTPTPAPTPTPTQPAYVFPRYLGAGDKGDDVLKLQQVLTQLGFLTVTPNGHYGPATSAAVKKFQKNHGIRQTGNVGVSTKTALDKIAGPAATTTKAQQISTLQQALQALITQAAQIQGK